MKKLIIIFVVFLFNHFIIEAQDKHQKNEYLYLGIGQGYDDGINWVTAFPTISLGYEKELSKFFSINFHLNSFYIIYGDSYHTDDANGHPIMDIIVEGAWGPFVTQDDIKKIKNVGIKNYESELVIKQYNLHGILSMNFNAIRFKDHKLGITLGAGFCYSTQNYFKDYYPIKKLTLNDGTIYEDIQLSQGTEFRSFDPFLEHIALFYEYKFNDYILGVKFGPYGYFYGNLVAYNWDSSVFFKLKL